MSCKMERIAKADLIVIDNRKTLVTGLRYDGTGAPVMVYKDRYKGFAGYSNDHKDITVENSPLARMLYQNMKVGEQIPRELYQAVAEEYAGLTKR